MFQSLGISAITSMIRKANDVQEGRTKEVQEGSRVINDDPEYNPKDDEVTDGEEMDDVVVHKTVKESRTKRPGVKKIANKKRKSSETSAAMPPGRVMAPPPGQTKRILEPDEPAPNRVTRQKAKMAAATDHQERMLSSVKKNSSLCFNHASSPLQCSLIVVHFPNGSGHANFEMNTNSETIKTACKYILQKNSKNICHKIKKKYFDTVAANKVNTKSLLPDLMDGELQALVEIWSIPRHKETCVSNKMNREKVVYQQRTGSRKKSVRVRSCLRLTCSRPRTKAKARVFGAIQYFYKAVEVVASSGSDARRNGRNQDEAEEYEVARDKELEMLHKKSQEQEEKLAHLMALFGDKAS
ncbi:hypothetical protein D1007_26026 [Hordeum vulgare]|nr:hypothetical protein D1007_26026 [Hordeum vulgare]